MAFLVPVLGIKGGAALGSILMPVAVAACEMLEMLPVVYASSVLAEGVVYTGIAVYEMVSNLFQQNHSGSSQSGGQANRSGSESEETSKSDSSNASSETPENTRSESEECADGNGDRSEDESDRESEEVTSESSDSSTTSSSEDEKDGRKRKVRRSKNQNSKRREKREPHERKAEKRRETREPYDTFVDNSSLTEETVNEIRLTKYSCNDRRAVNGSYHLVKRLTRLLRTAGMEAYVQNNPNFSISAIFQSGPSETEDRVNKKRKVDKISNHHASHVVRLQVNPDLEQNDSALYQKLRKYLAHSHYVHSSFNLKIGKRLDKLQGTLLNDLLSIEWLKETAANLSAEAKKVLANVQATWLEYLQSAITSGEYSSEQLHQLKLARDFIKEMSLEQLFEKIFSGFSYMDNEMVEREE